MAKERRPRFLLFFLAYAARLSGGDRHLLEVAARWRQHVDVAVVAPPLARDTVREFLGDVDVHTIGSSPPIGPRLALEYVRRSLVALARPLPQADVALASSHFTPDAAAVATLVRRGAFGVAYVYHLVAARAGTDARTLWSRNDERVGLALLRRHAALVFASNDATSNALSERGFRPVKTSVGIDLQRFRATQGTRIPNRGLFVGRLVSRKGVRDALEAWTKVGAAIPGAKLVVAGDGPERESMRALAHELGIAAAVEFVGFVSEEEKRRLLRESSVFLAPSHEEGWGIAVAEALASRIPVVAYRLPALDELFPSSYLAAPFGDPLALADLTVRALTDASFAASVARRGAESVSRYDVDRVAVGELEEILRRRSARARTQPTAACA